MEICVIFKTYMLNVKEYIKTYYKHTQTNIVKRTYNKNEALKFLIDKLKYKSSHWNSLFNIKTQNY